MDVRDLIKAMYDVSLAKTGVDTGKGLAQGTAWLLKGRNQPDVPDEMFSGHTPSTEKKNKPSGVTNSNSSGKGGGTNNAKLPRVKAPKIDQPDKVSSKQIQRSEYMGGMENLIQALQEMNPDTAVRTDEYQGNKGRHLAIGGLGTIAKALAQLSGGEQFIGMANTVDDFAQGNIMRQYLEGLNEGKVGPISAGLDEENMQYLEATGRDRVNQAFMQALQLLGAQGTLQGNLLTADQGVATQQAGLDQSAEQFNVGTGVDVGKANVSNQLAVDVANQGAAKDEQELDLKAQEIQAASDLASLKALAGGDSDAKIIKDYMDATTAMMETATQLQGMYASHGFSEEEAARLARVTTDRLFQRMQLPGSTIVID